MHLFNKFEFDSSVEPHTVCISAFENVKYNFQMKSTVGSAFSSSVNVVILSGVDGDNHGRVESVTLIDSVPSGPQWQNERKLITDSIKSWDYGSCRGGARTL